MSAAPVRTLRPRPETAVRVLPDPGGPDASYRPAELAELFRELRVAAEQEP